MYLNTESKDQKDIKLTQVKFEDRKNSNVGLPRPSYKVCKKEFLEEIDHIEVRKDLFDRESAAELEDFDPAIHDAWVVLCPKSINLSALTNKRIKMPGRSYVDNLQVRTTNYAEPLNQSIGYVNAKGKYTLRRMQLAGNMIVSKRLNMEKLIAEQETDSSLPKQSNLLKLKLPLRHPLFGRNYKELIKVDKETSKKLRLAEKQSTEATVNLRSTSNYYSIRSKMLATTQKLEEKEHDFRQSVLTGVFPKLMTSSARLNYVDLTNAEDDDNKPDGDKQQRQATEN